MFIFTAPFSPGKRGVFFRRPAVSGPGPSGGPGSLTDWSSTPGGALVPSTKLVQFFLTGPGDIFVLTRFRPMAGPQITFTTESLILAQDER